MKKLLTITLVFVFALALVLAIGCAKKEEPAPADTGMEQTAPPTEGAGMADTTGGAMMHDSTAMGGH